MSVESSVVMRAGLMVEMMALLKVECLVVMMVDWSADQSVVSLVL